MNWNVEFTNKARKQKDKLPLRVRELLFQLVHDIQATGPVRGDWPTIQNCRIANIIAISKKDNRHLLLSGGKTGARSGLWRLRMQVHTKKHPTEDMITLQLRVHRHNAPLVKRYTEIVESEEERTYTVAEVFPEYIGKESQVALRAYRTREALTQKQLSELTGIPQHHISEMETGKRSIGKERAKKLAEALHCDYRQLL